MTGSIIGSPDNRPGAHTVLFAILRRSRFPEQTEIHRGGLAAEGGTMRARHTSVVMFLIAGLCASPGWAGQSDGQKMGPLARQRSVLTTGWSRVIVRGSDSTPDADLQNAIAQAGGRVGRALSIINARVAEVPNSALAALANSSTVARISLDRPLLGSLERTGATVGATVVRQNLGLDGAGIGIAIIDS